MHPTIERFRLRHELAVKSRAWFPIFAGAVFDGPASLTKDRTARNLETQKIVSFVERIEEALAKAAPMTKLVTKIVKQEQERIRESYLRRRREKVQAYGRKRNRGVEMAM